MTDLLHWVLDHRHEHQNCQLVDLLDLARMWSRGEIGPKRPIQVTELEARWGVGRSCASIRLNALRHAGLVDYERGWSGDPGYRFHRIGPPACALQRVA